MTSPQLTDTGATGATQALLERARSYQATVLTLLRQVTQKGCPAKTVHAIRTHCRRLQALLELSGEEERAAVMAKSVRRLSKLRALQVFRQYLEKIDAPRADLVQIDARIERRHRRLVQVDAYRKITQALQQQGLPQEHRSEAWLRQRAKDLRHTQADALQVLFVHIAEKPRRKRLHALRLLLKTIRYQAEALPDQSAETQEMVTKLRQAQTSLGRYEELADFARWGKRWELKRSLRIKRDWKRARTKARAAATELTWLVDILRGGAAD